MLKIISIYYKMDDYTNYVINKQKLDMYTLYI